MEVLPFIDQHQRDVAASPERVWEAVRAFVRGSLERPAPKAFVALWELEPRSGFAVAEEVRPQTLVMRGRHRFSRYELAFSIEPGQSGVILSARTSAVFPGLVGRAYHALVIGTGGHGVIVRQMLRRIARAAEVG